MENISAFFQQLYSNFNNRNIDLVVSSMTQDVQWANGMDGGYVFGHAGVKEYWVRQFSMVRSHVTPIEIKNENEIIIIKVHQVVFDLEDQLLANDIVLHYFHLHDKKISRFDIGEK